MVADEVSIDEAELLRSIVRPSIDPALIRQRAERIRDLDRLTRLARKHGVLPLLYSRLAALDSASLSSPLADYVSGLRDEYCTNLAQNLASASELITLLDDFRRNLIAALPFKGVALAAAVYGDIGLRPAGDIDLLIFREDLRKASNVLLAHSYELKTPLAANGAPLDSAKHELHFERNSDGMIVELRWRLTQPHFGRDWGMQSLWPCERGTNLCGTQIPVLTPEETLILLCLHGSKHGWSRLIWVKDVAQLIETHYDLDWHVASRDAAHLGLSTVLVLGLLLSANLAGAQTPPRITQRVRNDKAVRLLAQHIAANFFDDEKRIPQGREPYHIQILDPADRVRWWWNSRPWHPNQRDRDAIRIPPALDVLYYLIRPFRLALEHFRPKNKI